MTEAMQQAMLRTAAWGALVVIPALCIPGARAMMPPSRPTAGGGACTRCSCDWFSGYGIACDKSFCRHRCTEHRD